MRSALLFVLSFWVTSAIYAQPVQQGVFNVGGTLAYSSIKTIYSTQWFEGYSKTSISELTPSFAYFVADQVQLGVFWSYRYQKTRYYSNSDEDLGYGIMSKQVGYGLNARYYYPLSGHAIFAGAGFMYTVILDKTIGRTYIGELGADVFLTRGIALEPSIQYADTPDPDEREKTFMVSLGLRCFFD